MNWRTCLLPLWLAAGLMAQDFRSTLQGTVTDPTQALVANAAVTVRNRETAQERTATTNADGFYLFQFLLPGNYDLTVKAPGFKGYVEKGINLALTQTLRQDVTLQLGDTAETVNVVANIAVCLVHQANYLLDRLIARLEQDFVKGGGLRERMTQARLEYRRRGGG